MFLQAVNDHQGDSYNGARIYQIKWYASKLGENYWMYDVSPFAILENKWCKTNINNNWFICYNSNLEKCNVLFKIPSILWILYDTIENFIWFKFTRNNIPLYDLSPILIKHK